MAGNPNKFDQSKDDNKPSQESSPVQTWGRHKSNTVKAIRRFRTWLKCKALRNQSTTPALSNDLIELDLTKSPPPYGCHDPTLDLPSYHDDLPFKPGAASALTAISTAISVAAAVVPPSKVAQITNSVATTIADVAKAAATLPANESLITVRTLDPDAPNTPGFGIALDPTKSNAFDIWEVRQDLEEISPFGFHKVVHTSFQIPDWSKPAFSEALQSALLNVIKAVIIAPAPSMMAVAEAYGSYAGHIARGGAQGVIATFPLVLTGPRRPPAVTRCIQMLS